MSGRILDPSGHPLSGLIVRAFDKSLRGEAPLGAPATSDALGRYRIAYSPAPVELARRGDVNLLVRVTGRAGATLGESPVVFSARGGAIVDVTVTSAEGRQSEYAQYLAQITPLLKQVGIATLTEADVSFVAGKTGIPELRVAWLAVAEQQVASTRVPAEVLYGLYRQDLPTNLAALVLQRPAALEAALRKSVDDNVIAAALEPQIARLAAQVHALITPQVLREGQPATSLGALMTTAGLSPEGQQAFASALVQHQGTPEELWKDVRGTAAAASVDALQDVLRLGLLTGNNTPLIAALQKRGVRSPRDLATLAPDALKAVVSAPDVLALVPSIEEGETPAAKATRIAGDMLEISKAAFPTAFLHTLLASDPNPARRDAARILQNVPAFELRDERVEDLLKQPNALTGVSDRNGATAVLKQAQRLLRVAETPEAAASLMSAGLGSARDVTSLSRQAFADQFGQAFGGAEQAMAYHGKAQQISATVSSMAAMAAASRDFLPSVIKGAQGPPPAADFQTLFGSYSLCECEDCRSVYSPAAYLVDLLQFINPKSGKKALATLRQRRPDIEHIPLTCENTNTPMPYVDLVLEILEFYVANGHLAAAAARDTGDAQAEDLAVTAQFTIDAAYQTLEAAVYPPSLPFHRPLETTRAYLGHLGTSLDAVMRTFQRGNVPDAAAIDTESLGLSPLERDILIGATSQALPEFYGYAANASDAVWIKDLRNVSQFLRRTELTYDELLALLTTRFVNGDGALKLSDHGNPPACDLTDTEVVGLDKPRLQHIHRFVRLLRALGWTPADLDASFDILQQPDITAALLSQVAAVDRLARDLKVEVRSLLALWGTLGTGEFVRVFQSKAVSNPPDPAFDLNAAGTGLETGGQALASKTPALLAALRLSGDDLALLRADAGLAADDAQMTLETLSALYRRTTLMRALKLRAKEFVSLRALTGEDPFQSAAPAPTEAFVARGRRVTGSPFSVAQLDYLYRDVSDPARPLAPLPSALEALLQQLVAGLAEIAGDEAAAAGPGELAAKQRGFITQTLSEAVGVESSTAALLLESVLRSSGNAAQPAIADFERLTGSGLTAAYFQSVDLTGPAASGLIATLDAEWSGPASPDPAIDPTAFSARWTGTLLAPAADTYTLFLRVKGGARLWIRGQLVIDQWAEPAAIVEHSAAVALTPGEPAAIKVEYFKSSDRGLAELRWSAAAAPKQIVPQVRLYPDAAFSFDPSRLAYRRLHKAAMLTNGFGITDAEWSHLAAHPSDFGGFDANALPLDPAQFSTALFAQWERLRAWFALRDRMPQIEATLVDVFSAGSRDEALAALERASGWDVAQVDLLAGVAGLNLTAADFKNEVRFAALSECLGLADRIGVGCDRLFAWAEAVPSAGMAQEIVSAVKAKYDPDAWRTVAKPLNDALRGARRTALVAYLLPTEGMRQRGIANGDQLFEFFLIDVEMEPCMVTSRIKQALSSVQLFIQRCLMNLEGLSPSVIDADVWEWMKNYRVWEANRKVFLYPENWIEPDLRDDKTPFFQDLESQLLQADLNAETAEGAFLSYLEKLDQVARLEVVGLHTFTASDDGGPSTTVDVIGRTSNKPYIHYHRQLADEVWSPWSKIDVEFEGDIVIPVVFNRRLYVYWPHFEQKPNRNQDLGAPYIQSMDHWRWEHLVPTWKEEHAAWTTRKMVHDGWAAVKAVIDGANAERDSDDQLPVPGEPEVPGDEPQEPEEPAYTTPPSLTHQAIQLCWTEFRDGKWSPKQTSHQHVTSSFATRTLGEYGFALAGVGGALVLGLINEVFPLAKEDVIGDTVVDVYTPAPNEHFFRTEIEQGSGDLLVHVYRRYEHRYRVLDMNSALAKGYDKVGHFRVVCGSKVHAFSKLEQKAYESLVRPEGFTNVGMSFVEDAESGTLTMKSSAKTLEVLRAFPDGSADYVIQPEHQRPVFALPAQRFFYQDRNKTYFAHYRAGRPLRLLSKPDRVVAAVSYAADVNLTSTIRQAQARQVKTNDVERREPRGGQARDRGSLAMVSETALHLSPAAKLSAAVAGSIGVAAGIASIQFETFFHPHLCDFLKRLYRKGVPLLLDRSAQLLDNDPGVSKKNVFVQRYDPASIVSRAYPREDVDFSGGAYSIYNWELFFHAPMLIATALGRNQRFEEAREWFHYVFNPTTDSGLPAPARYWNVRPFFENTHPEKDQIQNLLAALDSDDPADATLADRVRRQIHAWMQDPFNPHHIARMRVTAYQKHVVMKYIDNLIQWGDQLFSQNTIETINEATLLYVLAHSILGPRPDPITSHVKVDPKTYAELKAQPGGLDDFSNALVSFENEIPYVDQPPLMPYSSPPLKPLTLHFGKAKHPPPLAAPLFRSAAETFYFGIPPNTDLLKCWDTVEDRLFKIRNCMNIEGIVQQLPLFEPPIDPGLLVKARAAGLDLGSVLADINAPLPTYRFTFMVEKALALANELKSLSGALLGALEKKDGEQLAVLRTAQEAAVLKAVRAVRQQQIDEAAESLEGLRRTRLVTEARRDFYRDVLRISHTEQSHMDSLTVAHVFNEVSQGMQAAVSAAHVIPNFDVGTAGWAASPVVKATFGGNNLGSAAQALAMVSGMIAAQFSHDAEMASIKAEYDRRWDDWKLQERVANKELAQIDKQIAAAEIRSAIAASELANQELQIAHNQSTDELLRSKYTNQDLYAWMASQVSKVYFQAYKLAYDLAKRSERAFQIERGLTASNFVQFGYWDSLRKGLLAGEQLSLDLKRMESAYVEQNRREYEITKQVSLASLDPMALLTLKETGQCQITLPEQLFDMDYPGHYMRRIKTVSLTIPCVVGPFTSVNATLTLLSSEIRINGTSQRPYPKDEDEDPRFATTFASLQAIAASHSQNDSGLFDLNFRDERYLPFENAGAVSRWRLELTNEFRSFDFDTISDVVMQLRYTAREGGAALKGGAVQAVTAWLADAAAAPLGRSFSARHEFPTEWHRFLNPSGAATTQELVLDLSSDRFPFPFQRSPITITAFHVFLKLKDGFSYADGSGTIRFDLTRSGGATAGGNELTIGGSPIADVPHAAKTMQEEPGTWTLTVKESDLPLLTGPNAALRSTVTVDGVDHQRLNTAAIEDLWIAIAYHVG